MVPRQRQQRDVDSKADYGQVAVHQPGQHLERLEGPRPAVHPRRLGKNQFGPAAAVHGRRPPQLLTAAAHLEGSRSHFSSDVATFVEEMTYGNELGVMMATVVLSWIYSESTDLYQAAHFPTY